MKFKVKGTVETFEGPLGVDLEIEAPQRVARLITLAGYVIATRVGDDVPGDVREYFAVALERAMRDEG